MKTQDGFLSECSNPEAYEALILKSNIPFCELSNNAELHLKQPVNVVVSESESIFSEYSRCLLIAMWMFEDNEGVLDYNPVFSGDRTPAYFVVHHVWQMMIGELIDYANYED